jgi:transforming growth factor-beta-induced protein
MQQDASTNLRNTLMSANFTRLVEEMVKFDLADSVSKAGESLFKKLICHHFHLILMCNNEEMCSNRTQNDIRSEQSGFP